MRTAQEIDVVAGQSLHEFVQAVNNKLEYGWKLSGGVSVVFNQQSYITTFYQSVYREYEQPGAWG